MSSNIASASSRSAESPIVSLEIAGMSCGHCVAAVRSALAQVPGVRGGQVAVGSAQVAIDPAAGIAADVTRAAIAAIRDAGYDARAVAGASGAPTSSPSSGLPMMGSCCSPRQS